MQNPTLPPAAPADLSQARSTLWDASNLLDEVAEEILFLSVAVANAWDDEPANGLVYILNRLRETVKSTSDVIRENSNSLVMKDSRPGDEGPQP